MELRGGAMSGWVNLDRFYSPANVSKHLHLCGYHDSYHVASTGCPRLDDMNKHGEPIKGGKRDGRGNARVVREQVLATC